MRNKRIFSIIIGIFFILMLSFSQIQSIDSKKTNIVRQKFITNIEIPRITYEMQWDNNGTAICSASGPQQYPQLVSDGMGGAMIVWEDYRSGFDIYVQRISSSGVTQWYPNGTGICTKLTGLRKEPKIVTAGAGGAIIAWEDRRSGGGDIYAQRINFAGIVQWASNGTGICTEAQSQINPELVSDGAGGVIIVWTDTRNGLSDIYAQRVHSSGISQWTANGIAICTESGSQVFPQLVSDGMGGVIIVWQDRRSGIFDIYIQRIDSSGVALWNANGTAICKASDIQQYPQLVSDGAGGAIIAWEDNRSGTVDIYSQRINSSGVVQWAANGTAICTASNVQQYLQLVSDGTAGGESSGGPLSGGAIITWEDYRSENADIYSQRIDSSGMVHWSTNGTLICMAKRDQILPQLVSDGAGGATITWMDFRNFEWDIYAQRIKSSGMVHWTANGTAICTVTQSSIDSPQIINDGLGGYIITWGDYRNYLETDGDIYAQRIKEDMIENTLQIWLYSQTYNSSFFEFILLIKDFYQTPINGATLTVYWNNDDVSSSVVPLGSGKYKIIVPAILLSLEEDPIYLNVTASFEGYSPSGIDFPIKVDPAAVDKKPLIHDGDGGGDGKKAKEAAAILGYDIFFLMVTVGVLSLILILKRRIN